MNHFDLIVIGGGPAGIFAAIAHKKLGRSVLVLEKSNALLSKILLSGGGRCNLTNATFDPKELCKNYPRGAKELLGPFYKFQPRDTIHFFEKKGIKLKVEKDGRVFPASNSAKTIYDCLLKEVKEQAILVKLNQKITFIKKEENGFSIKASSQTYGCQKLLLATGSSKDGHFFAKELGHSIEKPFPALFAFKLGPSLKELSGISTTACLKIKDSSLSTMGDILFTHFGLSGPAVLRLSSFGAKELDGSSLIEINWAKMSEEAVFLKLKNFLKHHPKKSLKSYNIFSLPDRVWKKFLKDLSLNEQKAISNKMLQMLAKKLTSDTYKFLGKSPHKNEFVTCGGISLSEVNFNTMESKLCKGLYFAGEILDIDGLTGGFNFQNAWTSGFIAGSS